MCTYKPAHISISITIGCRFSHRNGIPGPHELGPLENCRWDLGGQVPSKPSALTQALSSAPMWNVPLHKGHAGQVQTLRLNRRLRLFYGLMISCETDGHESKPSSKGRSRITTGEKPHSYRRQRTERTASEDPLTIA